MHGRSWISEIDCDHMMNLDKKSSQTEGPRRLFKLSSIISLGALFFSTIFLMPITSIASDNGKASSAKQWQFDPNSGFVGRASIMDDNASRFDVSCGNGGAPGLTLHHPSSQLLTSGINEQRIPLIMKIDDEPFEQIFSCYREESVCVSFGFPSIELMTGVQRGKRMTIHYNEQPVANFTLTNSNATISKLAACLGPNRADWKG